MSVYISLFTVAIPVNYTNEFRELFEAATYIFPIGARGPFNWGRPLSRISWSYL